MEETPRKVLCVCIGNSDRSPLMAIILAMLLRVAGLVNVIVESAGILNFCSKGGSASHNGVVSAERLGLDLSGHNKRWVGDLDLLSYDLFVVVDENVAAELFSKHGIPLNKIINVQISNPWPSEYQPDHDLVAEEICGKMYRVITRHFSKR